MEHRAPLTTYSPDEYIVRERAAEFRSEFIDGQLVAMAGASRAHSLISINLGREVSAALREQECETYDSNMRVKVANTGLYTYPDLTIACGRPEFEDGELDTLTNPSVIFEILSSSTEAYDRGEKFARYRRLPSLREYVLISQSSPRVERFARAGEVWVMTAIEGMDGVLELDSVRCRLSLGDVFERVSFSGEG